MIAPKIVLEEASFNPLCGEKRLQHDGNDNPYKTCTIYDVSIPSAGRSGCN